MSGLLFLLLALPGLAWAIVFRKLIAGVDTRPSKLSPQEIQLRQMRFARQRIQRVLSLKVVPAVQAFSKALDDVARAMRKMNRMLDGR